MKIERMKVMLFECKNSDKNTILEYIGKDYGKCLYIYIDLCKYGLDNENFNAWIQYGANGEITAVVTEYYRGIQIYSKEVNLDGKELSDFMKQKNPPIILGMKETIDTLKQYLPEYQEELGTVGQLKEIKSFINPKAYSAEVSELKEIVGILAEDEGIGKPYGFDSLYKQYKERKEEGFGRNYVLRDEKTNDIICHAGTYAEISELAVIGGVITAPEYRGKGYSKETLAAICRELLDEGKDVFSFYYIPSAIKMHQGVGFEKIGDWAKLIK